MDLPRKHHVALIGVQLSPALAGGERQPEGERAPTLGAGCGPADGDLREDGRRSTAQLGQLAAGKAVGD